MEGFFDTEVETIENIKDDEVKTLKDFSFVTGEFIWLVNCPFFPLKMVSEALLWML